MIAAIVGCLLITYLDLASCVSMRACVSSSAYFTKTELHSVLRMSDLAIVGQSLLILFECVFLTNFGLWLHLVTMLLQLIQS